jgi:hypothetical protein
MWISCSPGWIFVSVLQPADGPDRCDVAVAPEPAVVAEVPFAELVLDADEQLTATSTTALATTAPHHRARLTSRRGQGWPGTACCMWVSDLLRIGGSAVLL